MVSGWILTVVFPLSQKNDILLSQEQNNLYVNMKIIRQGDPPYCYGIS